MSLYITIYVLLPVHGLHNHFFKTQNMCIWCEAMWRELSRESGMSLQALAVVVHCTPFAITMLTTFSKHICNLVPSLILLDPSGLDY